MNKQQPEALRLAHTLSGGKLIDDSTEWADTLHAAAAELRHQHARIAELEAQLSATQPAAPVPQGWKLVPVEPTEKMISEGCCAQTLKDGHRYIGECAAKTAWSFMLAAAPTPPAAATTVMPEPFAYVEHHKAGDNLWFDHPGGKHSALYTEQQVRELLALIQ